MAGLFERMGLVRTEYEGMPEIPMQPVSEPSTPAQGAGRTVRVRHLLPFLGHVQQLSKTFYGKKNNRVPYFETLTAILKTILLEIEKSSPLTKHMPNKCGVVKNASRRSILARSSVGRAADS